MALLFAVFAVNLFSPDIYRKFLVPIAYLENHTVFYIGLVLLHISMLWIIIAQLQMGKSWRIGIDEDHNL